MNLKKIVIALVMCVTLAFSLAANAFAYDLEAGPIWNQGDAEAKCPAVCEKSGTKWNGNWVTTVPGEMSVCGCDQTLALEAGPIWNNDDAKGKCPAVCENKAGAWDGNWWTTVWGAMSVCSCKFS
ncbi:MULTISPECIES: mannan-binding lectin [Moorena]|nr:MULTISPECIES: mannan-binding lectin [Moorena]NEO16252.1 lectin MVL [Moorena sp. SIO3E8]NEP27734.1 lectin MVL [Moorena sp. SIO3I6]NEQ02758.1 lectin MVL [Moorena sp. SIO3F7]